MTDVWTDADDLARQGYENRVLRKRQIALLDARHSERSTLRDERAILDAARDATVVLAELLRRFADQEESP